MNIARNELIEDLLVRTRENLNAVEQFKQLPAWQLNWRKEPESWNVLECIEHLNLYGQFYLPEISHCLKKAAPAPEAGQFKSGLLGNYFALNMLPKEKGSKIKTFKDKNPLGSKPQPIVLEEFTEQQKKLLELLKQARQVNLSKVKTAISITRLLKLKLGDTLRVLIYHNQRHIAQAQKVLQELRKRKVEAPAVAL